MTDLEVIKNDLKKILSEKRFEHSLAVCNLWSDSTEQLCNSLLLFEVREYDTARVGCILLRTSYEWLDGLTYSVSMRLWRIRDEAMFDNIALRCPA